MTQVIQNVSDTAFMVAGFRAAENERPNPLFRDPLAAKLAGDHDKNILATMPKAFMGAWSVVIRTVIIDNLINQALAEGVDTILNLGAGLDTRPYRMALPKTLRWVEVDYPHVIALKEERLAGEEPYCRLKRIKLDLTDRAARRQFLADMSAEATKVLVLNEGVAPYLTETDVVPTISRRPRRFAIGSSTTIRPRRSATAKRCAPASCATRHFVSRHRIGLTFSQATAGARARCVIGLMRRGGLAGRFRCLGSCGCG